jgi:hypothetical protein
LEVKKQKQTHTNKQEKNCFYYLDQSVMLPVGPEDVVLKEG